MADEVQGQERQVAVDEVRKNEPKVPFTKDPSSVMMVSCQHLEGGLFYGKDGKIGGDESTYPLRGRG